MKAFLSGKFSDLKDCYISVLDRGFLFADSVYEVMTVVSRKTFAADRHLRRLDYSLEQLGIENPYTPPRWEDIFQQVIDQSGMTDLALYTHITRGQDTHRQHVPGKDLRPTTLVMPMALDAESIKNLQKHGVSVQTGHDYRWSRCDIKAPSLLPNVLARMDAVKNSCHETILIRNGKVCEGTSSNVFIVQNELIKTPPVDNYKLNGVTRGLVLEIAHTCGKKTMETPIEEDELFDCDEIFLSSTTYGIIPVTQIDGHKTRVGTPSNLSDEINLRLFECASIPELYSNLTAAATS